MISMRDERDGGGRWYMISMRDEKRKREMNRDIGRSATKTDRHPDRM